MQGYSEPPGLKGSMTAVNRAGRRRPLPSKPFKKVPAASNKPVEAASSSASSDLPGMLAQVQQHIDMFQYEEARDVCSRAVLLAPEDADIRYQLGCICLELGDFQGGFENIRLSLNLEPETTPDRFFAFAQLIPGREAVQVYEHGLKVYSELLGATSKEIRRKVSTACCAASEIFMTDLCEDEDAEIQSSSWLERAMDTDPTNPEVFRVLADLRMCQEKPEEAREFIQKACSLWAAELDKLISPEESEDSSDDAALMAEFPSYESRISGAKILIELGDFEMAVSVLEQLLKEDDSVLMTWYLLGFALKSSQSPQSNLEDAIEGALRVARRDGHLLYPQMTSEDELVLEILTWSRELDLQIDLDAVEEDESEEAVMDLEEALKEAERLDEEGNDN